MSDYKGVALMTSAFPAAKALLGDKGYDAGWYRNALADKGIATCIPSKANRKVVIPHDTTLYRQRRKIENMSGKIKDWPRIHTRYDALRTYLHVSHLHHGNHHLLDQSMGPEPRRLIFT